MSKLARKIMTYKRRVALVLLVAFIAITFYSSTKKEIKGISKEILPKSTTDANMNSREGKANSEITATDPSDIDVYKPDGEKKAYLTFDDGPSTNNTPEILKILDKYNIKATFFIIGNRAIISPKIVEMEVQDGQSIGNHTYSHDYKNIYSNADNFISDVNRCDAVLKSIIGSRYKSKLFRFPGGSSGAIRAPLRVVIKNAGYHYVDWNDLTGDSDEKNITVTKILSNLKKYTKGKEHVVILMHDAPDKETTVQALPEVIEYLKSQGYSFNTLK